MSDFVLQEKRIEQILGAEDVQVSKDSLALYRTYLQNNIVTPFELTGIEDFRWEEYYIFGPGDKKEYENLKKNRPSYTDKFMFMKFDNLIDDTAGIMIRVRRISDRKQFVLPLAELKATDKKTMNYQLLDDYSVWFVNY